MARGKVGGKLPNKRVTQHPYDPEVFIPFLRDLIDKNGQSFRQTSLGSGLDHGAVRRYLNGGTKPARDACISLAYHFDIHPNLMLEKAGYPPLDYFDLSLADPSEMAPEVKEVARELMRLENPHLRRRVCQSMLQLIQQMFTAPEVEPTPGEPSKPAGWE